MNILRIHSFDGPTRGGAEFQMQWADEELASRDHRVTTVLFLPQVERAPPLARAYAVGREGSRFWRDVRDPEARRFLMEVYRSSKPDVIHLHHFQSRFGAIARFLAEVPTPVVFTAHDAEVVCPISTLILPDGSECEGGVRWRCQFTGCRVGRGLPLNLLERRAFDRLPISCFVCPSGAIDAKLRGNGYGPTVRVAPIVPEAAIAQRRGNPTPCIGFLGRWEEYKGIGTLIAAVDRLSARQTVRLDLAGAGPFEIPARPWLTRRGWVDGEAKETWFGGIDVLAVPSRFWENYGLVAAEAVMRGLPVVVSEVGGLPEVVPPEWRVPLHHDLDAAASAWENALSAILEPERLARARELAKELRERILSTQSARAHVDRMLEVYAKALRPMATSAAGPRNP